MKILIVGAGAMGCFLAARLHQAGVHTWLLEKNDSPVEAITRNGIILEDSAGTHAVSGFAITRDAASVGQADYVIFFVKAFDTRQAAAFASSCVGSETVIVTLQNGIGNSEILKEYFPAQSVLAGTTAHGATLLGPGHIRHAGSGDTAIGALQPRERASALILRDLFETAGISTRIADDVQSLLWGKLFVNIGINPLAAILDICNGKILELEQVRSVMHAAVREGVAVAAAKSLYFSADEQIARVETVCRATRGNVCSMLQDLRAGRMTEIDYLNGAVVREARSFGMPVPVNSMLSDLVRARQKLAAGS